MKDDIAAKVKTLNRKIKQIMRKRRRRDRKVGVPIVKGALHIKRNDRCPCGSGRKFKACHGGAE
jgi:uncharacterized protein YecA (UPF0149 family)